MASLLSLPEHVFAAHVICFLDIRHVSLLDTACCCSQSRQFLYTVLRGVTINNSDTIASLRQTLVAWLRSRKVSITCARITCDTLTTKVADLMPTITTICMRELNDSRRALLQAITALLAAAPKLRRVVMDYVMVCLHVSNRREKIFRLPPSVTEMEVRKFYHTGLGHRLDEYNDLRVSILAQVPQLQSLKVHHLEFHMVEGNPIKLTVWEGLRIQDADLRRLSRMGWPLREVVISSCEDAQDTSVADLAKRCQDLQVLKLGALKLTHLALIALAEHCRDLRNVALGDGAAFTDAGLVCLAQRCPQLREVVLAGGAHCTDASAVAFAKNCRRLHVVDLARCQKMTDTAIIALARGCPGLVTVTLTNCPLITDAAIVALAQGCRGLHTLHMAGCPLLTDAALLALCQHSPQLRVLEVTITVDYVPGRVCMSTTGLLSLLRCIPGLAVRELPRRPASPPFWRSFFKLVMSQVTNLCCDGRGGLVLVGNVDNSQREQGADEPKHFYPTDAGAIQSEPFAALLTNTSVSGQEMVKNQWDESFDGYRTDFVGVDTSHTQSISPTRTVAERACTTTHLDGLTMECDWGIVMPLFAIRDLLARLPMDILQRKVLAFATLGDIVRLDRAVCNAQTRAVLRSQFHGAHIHSKVPVDMSSPAARWARSRGLTLSDVSVSPQNMHMCDLSQSECVTFNNFGDTKLPALSLSQCMSRVSFNGCASAFMLHVLLPMSAQQAGNLRELHCDVQTEWHTYELNQLLVKFQCLRKVVSLSTSIVPYALQLQVTCCSPALHTLVMGASQPCWTDECLVALAARCTQLREVRLGHCELVSGAGVAALVRSSRWLVHLTLSWLELADERLYVRDKHHPLRCDLTKGLQILVLDDIPAGDCDLIEIFHSAPNLRVLSVGYDTWLMRLATSEAQITDAALAALSGFRDDRTAEAQTAPCLCPELEQVPFTCCRALQSGGLAAMVARCKKLRFLGVEMCPRIGRDALVAMKSACPDLKIRHVRFIRDLLSPLVV